MKARWPWAKKHENLVSLKDQYGQQLTEWKGFDGPTNAKTLMFRRVDEPCLVVGYTVINQADPEHRHVRSYPLEPMMLERYDRPTLAAGTVDTER